MNNLPAWTNTHLQITEGLVDRLIELGKPFDYVTYPIVTTGSAKVAVRRSTSSLLAYMDSAAFDPKVALTPELVAGLFTTETGT